MFDADTVSPTVRDAVVIALWLPPIVILVSLATAIGIATVGMAWTLATSGTIPDVGGIAGTVDPTLAVVAVGGAVGYLYLILANETFGTDTVEAAADQAEQATESIDDAREGS
jgi:hypothetical protein